MSADLVLTRSVYTVCCCVALLSLAALSGKLDAQVGVADDNHSNMFQEVVFVLHVLQNLHSLPDQTLLRVDGGAFLSARCADVELADDHAAELM